MTANRFDPTTAILDEESTNLDAIDEREVSTDLVRAYLNGIGRTKLLTAAQEVELAKRIEAGLFAEEKLATCEPGCRHELRADLRNHRRRGPGARKTTCWRRTCGWWSASPSATPAAAWPSST